MSKMVNEKVYNKLLVNVIGTWNRLKHSNRTIKKPFTEFAEYAGLNLKSGYNEQNERFYTWCENFTKIIEDKTEEHGLFLRDIGNKWILLPSKVDGNDDMENFIHRMLPIDVDCQFFNSYGVLKYEAFAKCLNECSESEILWFIDRANDNVTKFSENMIDEIEEFAAALERYIHFTDFIDDCAAFVRGK